MGRPFSTALHAMRRMVESEKGWTWFCRIIIPTGEFRLVRDTVHRELGGQWWQRCPMQIQLPAENQSGGSDTFSVVVPNVNRIGSSYVEIMGEPLGRELELVCINEIETAIDPSRVISGIIVRAPLRAKSITFEVGHNTDVRKTPSPIFDRRRFRSLLATGGIRR